MTPPTPTADLGDAPPTPLPGSPAQVSGHAPSPLSPPLSARSHSATRSARGPAHTNGWPRPLPAEPVAPPSPTAKVQSLRPFQPVAPSKVQTTPPKSPRPFWLVATQRSSLWPRPRQQPTSPRPLRLPGSADCGPARASLAPPLRARSHSATRSARGPAHSPAVSPNPRPRSPRGPAPRRAASGAPLR